MNDESYMAQALKLADRAGEEGEVPVGAIIVHASVKFGVSPDCIPPMKKQLGKLRLATPWNVEGPFAHFELRVRPSRP